MKKLIPIIICLLLSFGCSSPKPDAYLFSNQKLFSVFSDKQYTFSEADRFFRKSGYTVRHISFAKFSDLSKEGDIVKNRTKSLPQGAIFWTDNLQMTVFMSNLSSYQSAAYKFISYHYDIFQKDSLMSPTQTLINFYPAPDVFYRAIVRQIDRISSADDYSDTVYLYCSSYPVSANVADSLKSDYPAVKVINCSGKSAVRNAITSAAEQYKHFIVFCFDYNAALSELDEKTVSDKTLIEVMTEYAKIQPLISRSILIDEPVLADHALHSRQLHRYLADKPITAKNDKSDKPKDKKAKNDNKKNKNDNKPVNAGVTNVMLNHDNIIRIAVQPHKKTDYGVKLEEFIKENNKKKEKKLREKQANENKK